MKEAPRGCGGKIKRPFDQDALSVVNCAEQLEIPIELSNLLVIYIFTELAVPFD